MNEPPKPRPAETAAPAPCKTALHLDKHDYHLVDTEEGIVQLLDRLSQEKMVGLDTETTDISPLLAHLVESALPSNPVKRGIFR